MGNVCFKREDEEVKVIDWGSSGNATVDPREVEALLARTEAQVRFERQEEAAQQARLNQLRADINSLYRSAPKRRMRLRKTASKHKSKKTRSQYAKKKKGVKK
jgi:hypothetical protein